MKTTIVTSLFLTMMIGIAGSAQETTSGENFGNTLNLGVGVGYYGYIGYSMPVFHADFEFGVAKNFTLAPFFTYYSYQKDHYWGAKNGETDHPISD